MKKYIKNILMVSLVALACGALTGCSDEKAKGDPNPYERIPLARGEEEVVKANYDFALRLASEASKAEYGAGDNVIISPLSLSMALSMTANGAAGETRDELLEVLGFADDELAAANSLNKKLMEKLPGLDRKTTVSLANAIWFDGVGGAMAKDAFVSILSDNYSAGMAVFDDLSSTEAMNGINSWADKNTNGLIPQFLSTPLPENSRIALTNALYFKGNWATEFLPANTVDKDFHNGDGTTSKVRMMCDSKYTCKAYEEDNYMTASLKYGNGAYTMLVILPKPGHTPVEIIEELDIMYLRMFASGGGYPSELNLQLPKFSIETSLDYSLILRGMGVSKAFDDADFSEMWENGSRQFHIGKVLQSTKIEVDEQGTKAVAVSAVIGGDGAPGPMRGGDFIVDRPFVFMITEGSTGVVLFTGVVNKL